jgi:hypothetical protein
VFRRPFRTWHEVNRPWVGYCLAIGGLVAFGVQVGLGAPAAVEQVLGLASSLTVLGVVMLYVMWASGELDFWGGVFLWTVVLTRVLLGLGSGLHFQAIEVLLPLGLASAALHRRVPLAAGGLVICCLVLLEPVKQEFRANYWKESIPAATPVEGLRGYTKAASASFRDGDPVGEDLDRFSSRVGSLLTLAEVMSATPGKVSYWEGESYYPLLLKPVPRFLFPGKPLELAGQTFGHRYGWLDRNDSSTSYNFPQLIELYANFGSAGVMAGMVLLGVFFAALVRLVESIERPGQITIGAYALSPLFLIESNLSLVLPGTVLRLICVAAVTVIVSQAMRRRPS